MSVPSFSSALLRSDVAVIAEIKRSSPSRGPINPGMRADSQAVAYRNGGASAISVLTEPTRFGGAIADVASAGIASGLPILRKDFIVTESQLTEARDSGASAALIIVRAIDPSRLRSLREHADGISLELLFEIRDERELRYALDAGARIVGVNNRNLETLEIDSTTVARVLPLIPPDCIAVAESGYMSRAAVETAAAAGADAVLVGSSVSAAENPEIAVKTLTGIAKASRG